MAPQNIVIVGAGIVGTSTAYYLSRSSVRGGASISLIDSVGVATAASGKSGGFLARDWHGAATASLGELSFDLHAQLAEESDDGGKKWGYRRVDTLSVSIDASRKDAKFTSPLAWLPQGSVESSRSLGTPKTTAQVTPGLVTKELLSRFLNSPNSAYIEEEAVGLKISASNTPTALTIKNKNGSIRDIDCDCLILCAGPWTGNVARTLLGLKIARPLMITGARAHSVILKTEDPLSAHALFTEVTAEDGGASEPELYPRPDGTAYICGASDNAPLPSNPAEVTFDPKSIVKLHAQSKALSPVFNNATTIAEQACYLPMPDRGTPLIGKVKGLEGVYISAGHSCWGITLGPGSGKVMAELVLEGKVTSANISKLAP